MYITGIHVCRGILHYRPYLLTGLTYMYTHVHILDTSTYVMYKLCFCI